jgi:hypothetical protein
MGAQTRSPARAQASLSAFSQIVFEHFYETGIAFAI